MTHMRRMLIGGLLALAVGGCRPIQSAPTQQGQPLPAASPTTAIPPEEEQTPMPPAQLPTTPDVEYAVNDLAQRLSVDPSAITLVRVEEVDWPDGSLGCPAPDMNYRQMLTNGVYIQLRAGEVLYSYHGGGGRPPFLCTSPQEWVPGTPPLPGTGDPDV